MREEEEAANQRIKKKKYRKYLQVLKQSQQNQISIGKCIEKHRFVSGIASSKYREASNFITE